MRDYYIVQRNTYRTVRAFSIADARHYAKMHMGIKSPKIEDDYQDIQGMRNTGLTELPFAFKEQYR